MIKKSKHNRRRFHEEFYNKDDFDWDVTSFTEGEVERTREIVLTEEDLQRQAAKAEAEAKELIEILREEDEASAEELQEDAEESWRYKRSEVEPGYLTEGLEELDLSDEGIAAYYAGLYTDEAYSSEVYDGEEAFEEEEACEEQPYEEESYEEAYPSEVYYTEEDYPAEADYVEEPIGEYYAEDYPSEGGYEEAEYADSEYEEPLYDESDKPVGNIFIGLWEKFLNMETFDKIVMSTGAAVILLAVVVGGLYLGSRMGNQELSELADVGTQLDGIDLIGEKGLVAVADARLAQIAAANALLEEEEPAGYDEAEYSNEVTIKLEMTSVLKDLKIKFTNKETGKLVANVPFSVTITDPDGKTAVWKDEDMDGIIYKKGITPGKYKVSMDKLADEKYDRYTLPDREETVEVKKDIAYEKIDVSNEVKTEAEINVAQEDTKKNDTVVESTLQDTVTWLESTSTSNTYTEVPKSSIPDPKTLVLGNTFLRTTSISGGNAAENKAFTIAASVNAASVAVGKQVSVKITASGYTTGASIKYTAASENSGVATVAADGNGGLVITGVAAGKTKVNVSADYASGASAPSNKVVIDVTVTDKKTISLDKTALTVYLSDPEVLKAKITDDTATVNLSAVSSDANVATVAVLGREVTITGVAAGSAVITVSYQENGEETHASCTVVVKENPKNDKKNKLKDANGEQLYVLENGAYREAVYADYYSATQFFIKGEPKYTGWQTIDGKVYYFDANGKKVTGEQIIQGAKYNFASDGSLVTGTGTLGIDVSKWNGTIDWKAVKNSGVSYVIIRCGYRGSSQGMLVEDPKFNTNIKGATAAGLKVGVYFFTQATDEVEAVEEASYVLDKIKNYKISYPVFLDVETSGGRGDKIDKTTRTAVCKAFCETIRRSGYTSGIYANKTWLNDKIDTGSLSAYKIWLAQYAATPTYSGRYDLWQYKSTGKVSGISGNVDLNLSYLGY
ncbi:MAG: hypothetical protein IJ833_03310 [Lachnospiraceae bacterium]|nr:hypothetical protein [Lachnospiraceae bacterium]